MTSVKLKFKASAEPKKGGTLYFQVIHDRVVRQVSTNCCICVEEWNEGEGGITVPSDIAGKREKELAGIRESIMCQQKRLNDIVHTLDNGGKKYTTDEVVLAFKAVSNKIETVFNFFLRQITLLRQMGKAGTAATYQQTLNSIKRFRQDQDLYFETVTQEFALAYETWLRMQHLCRNTTSFYMRILRTIYNKAVDQQLTTDQQPFKNVYTGIDKTAKRALTIADIKRIKNINLSHDQTLDFARDFFMLSFYLRGMSPIDLAFLRKSDLSNGYVTYCRRKTGQQMCVFWEKHMQQIIDKYPDTGTQYLLPLIQREDGTELQQYHVATRNINRKLKKISSLLHIIVPLTLYVARHSWASIAHADNVPISIISGAMGHDSEITTQIYLASIRTSLIDHANHNILKKL